MTFTTQPVYEVIRIIRGVPLFFQAHMERFYHSLELMGAHIESIDLAVLKGICELVQSKQVPKEANVRLECGMDSCGAWSWHIQPSQAAYPEEDVYHTGVRVVSERQQRDTPHAKILRQDYVTRMQRIKTDTGAFEVLLVNASGEVLEGSRSNILFTKQGSLYSPPASGMLMGVTRKKVLETAKELGMPYVEAPIHLDECASFDGCVLTGTSLHILPVHTIDAMRISLESEGVPALMEAFQKCVAEDIESMAGCLPK